MPLFFCMPFFACNRQIDSLDKRQCNLQFIPHEIERYDRCLEELLLDMNHIEELPKSLFRLQKLRRLGLSDNDIHRIPSEISNLQNLYELNVSRNDISDLPDELKNCQSLSVLDISSNPIARLPDSITNVVSLTSLSLNDTSLTKLPQDIGKLVLLKSLEVRENHLRSLPTSIDQLTQLTRLDLGQNELEKLPNEIGALHCLEELYVDDNSLERLPDTILHCKFLEQLDVSSNRLLILPTDLGEMTNLADLTLSHNCLSYLPNSISQLKKLTILRLDDNSILQLTPAIGSCILLNELNLMQNLISELPSSIGNLTNLQNLNVDKNQLTSIPALIGNCSKLTLLSLRDNQIKELPMEIGKLAQLRVLDVCNNRLSYLPFTINVLYNLQALWLSENQSQALLKLQQDVDQKTGMKVLICYLLPQQSNNLKTCSNNRLPNRSFVGGPKVHFGDSSVDDFDVGTFSSSSFGNFERHGTPHPKSNVNNSTINVTKPLKKQSIDGHIIPRPDDPNHHPKTIALKKKPNTELSNNVSFLSKPNQNNLNEQNKMPKPALKHSTAKYYCQDDLTNQQNNDSGFASSTSKLDIKNASSLKNSTNDICLFNSTSSISALPSYNNGNLNRQIVTKQIIICRNSKFGLGLSIAGGIESNPYVIGDSGLFISKLIPNAPAEKAGLKVGDKVLEINGNSMMNERHDVAVQCIQKSPEILTLIVSREEILSNNVKIDAKNVKSIKENNYVNDILFSDNSKQIELSNVLTTNIQLNENGQPNFSVENRKTLSNSFFFISSIFAELQNNMEKKQNIEVGDKILSINGQSIQDKSLDEVLTLLKGKPGSEIYLVLEKNDKKDKNCNQEKQKKYNYNFSTNQNTEKKIFKTNSSTTNLSYITPESNSNEYKNIEVEKKSFTNNESNLTVADLPYGNNRFDNLVEEVELIRDCNNALGLSIVGGIDHCSHPFGVDMPGVFISKIALNSPAAVSRRLRVGDRILKVNGKDVSKAKHGEAVEALKNSGSKLYVLIKHDPQPIGLKEVTFQRKNSSEKLGITICGGINSSPVLINDPTDEGIFIEHIDEKGCAGTCPELKAGQRILEVNDNSLLGCTKHEAAEMLKAASPIVRLLVCDGFCVEENGVKKTCLISSSLAQNGLKNNISNSVFLSTTIPNDQKSLSYKDDSLTNVNSNNSIETTKFAVTLSNFPSINKTKTNLQLTTSKPNLKQMSSQNQYTGWSLNSNFTNKQIQNKLSKTSNSTTLLSQNLTNEKKIFNNDNYEKTEKKTIQNGFKSNLSIETASISTSAPKSLTQNLKNDCDFLSNSTSNFNVDYGLINKNNFQKKELEQQKQYEWRQARLESFNDELNQTEKMLNNLKKISNSKIANLEKIEGSDCDKNNVNLKENQNNKLLNNINFCDKLDTKSNKNINDIKYVDA